MSKIKQRIIRNISANLLIKMITYIFSFAEVMYVSRVLKTEIYGRASFATSVVGYFVMFANLGMPIYAMRTCACKRDDAEGLKRAFSELWSIGVVTSVFSAGVFVIAVCLVPNFRANSILFLIFGSSVLSQAFNCEWLYKGLEKYRFIAVSSLLCKTVSFLLCVLFVHSEESILVYACVSAVGTCGYNLICFFMRKKLVGRPVRFILNREHFKPLLTFFLMSCAVTLYANIDLVMLGFIKTETEIGLYGIASKGKEVMVITGGLVWSAILPVATALWRDGNRERFESLAAKSLVIVSVVQICVAAISFIFAKPIILIIGGSDYLEAVPAFRVLMLSIPPIAASNILGGQVLIPTGHEKKLLTAEIVGAIVNLLANFVVIPRYSIVGAAFTTVASEVVVWFMCVYYCKKEIDMKFGISLVFRVARKFGTVVRTQIIKIESRIRGDKLPYFCPCCNTFFKNFADGKYIKHPNKYDIGRYEKIDQKVICPICGALPRHRILVSWFDNNIDRLTGREILYFAPEKSVMRWLNRHEIKCTTADLYNEAELKLDIENTGLSDGTYDIVVCNHVLEHVSDYKKALKELYRIISPEGMVIISFPVDLTLDTVYEDSTLISEADRVKHFGQYDHLRVFGKDTALMLEKNGFKVSEVSGDSPECNPKIKPVSGPADYDYNVLWRLTK